MAIAYYSIGSMYPPGAVISVVLSGYATTPIEEDYRLSVVIGAANDDDLGTTVLTYTIPQGTPDGLFTSAESTFNPATVLGSVPCYVKLVGAYYGEVPPSLNAHTITLIGETPPVVTSLQLSSVEVLAQGSLLLQFNKPVKNNVALQNSASYIITALYEGVTTQVVSVQPGKSVTTDQVVIHFYPPTIGCLYTLTVSDSVVDEDGNGIDPTHTTATFLARKTKMDMVMQGLPDLYDRSYDGVLRNLLQVISREDEAIGGAQEEIAP